YFAGMIEAMGGSQGGDGGFVETSSRGILSIPAGAAVDVSSPLGLGGRWLLDSRDITIVASGGTQASVPELNALNTNTDGSINAAVIETALASGDVTLTASRDITVASSITATPTANVTFTLQADHSIILNSGVGITGNGANTLSVVLNADRDATGGGAIVLNSGSSITSNGGNITLGGGTDPATTAAIGTAANTAGITLSGVTLNAGAGAISIQGQGFSNAATAGADGGVGIALSGTNAITAAAVTLTGTGGAGSDGDNTTRPGGAGGTGLVWDGTNTVTGALSLTGTGGVGGQGDAPANNETGGIGGAGGAGLDLKTTVDPTAALILTGTGGTGGAGGGSTGGMNRTGGDGGAGGSGVVLANGITVGGTNQTIAATLGTGGAEGSGTTTPGTAGANGSQVGLLGSATLDATSLSLETGISATYTLTGSQQGTISGGGVSAPSGTLNFQAVSSVQGHTGTADTVIGTASADSFDMSASNTISVAEVTFTGVENLNLIVNNIFVQRGDSDTQQLTIAGVGLSSLGVVYDSINNDYYFSEQFLENYSLGSYTLTANNKFEIVSLYDALLVNASFPKFSAGNEFVMDATHSIDAPGDFSIDVGSGIISGSILPRVSARKICGERAR
ncbi:MAG: beta strand repeat-containing protein, partial [Prochlorothrix sp.]